MPRFPKQLLEEILKLARNKVEKFTTPLPDNVTAQTVLKTKDVHIDVHKDLRKPDERVARIQADNEAQSSSVKKWIRDAKQTGHAGTHKNISEVRYNVKDFDIDDFERKVKDNSF